MRIPKYPKGRPRAGVSPLLDRLVVYCTPEQREKVRRLARSASPYPVTEADVLRYAIDRLRED